MSKLSPINECFRLLSDGVVPCCNAGMVPPVPFVDMLWAAGGL